MIISIVREWKEGKKHKGIVRYKERNREIEERERYIDKIKNTICLRTSDPFYIVIYYKNGSLLLGHTVHTKQVD